MFVFFLKGAWRERWKKNELCHFLNNQEDSLSGQDFRNSGYPQALSISVLALFSVLHLHVPTLLYLFWCWESLQHIVYTAKSRFFELPSPSWRAQLCWGQNCRKVKVSPWHHSHLPHPSPHSWPCNWFLLLVPNGVVFPHLLSRIKCSVNSFMLKDS